jgi:glucose dehydrogenase
MKVRPIKVAALVALMAPVVWSQVPYERIVRSDSEPENWLTYAGSYLSHWYSGLDKINKKNVSRLRPAWVYELPVAIAEFGVLSMPTMRTRENYRGISNSAAAFTRIL